MSRIELSPTAEALNKPTRTWGEWLAWIATEDHCEWANKYVATVRTPLGVLVVGALLALLCGLFVAPQGFAIFGAIVCVILLGIVWPLVAVRAISAELSFASRRGREGKPAPAKLVVANRWPFPVWGLSIDEPSLMGDTEGSVTAVALARINGWARSTFNCDFTPPLRGLYPQREVRISTGFPFGIYQASRTVDVDEPIVVWPQTFWLPPLSLPPTRRDWSGTVTDRMVGAEGTRQGIREHRPGDPLRDVHWAKTARYDRLVISEREAAGVEEITLSVDITPESHSTPGCDSTLEWSLRIAASICESAVSGGAAVTLLLGEQQVVARNRGGELERLLDSVATFDQRDPTPMTPIDRSLASARLRPDVAIVANGCEKSADRAIHLDTAGFEGRISPASRSDAWINVSSPDEVAHQVLCGWRTGRRHETRLMAVGGGLRAT